MIKLDEFVRVVSQGAIANFNKYGHVEPTFIAVNAQGEWDFASLTPAWRNDRERKGAIFDAMRSFARERHAVRCAFICEAYVLDAADVGNEAVQRSLDFDSLAFVPGRREVVQISAEDRFEGVRQGTLEIERVMGSKPRLRPLKIEMPKVSVGQAVSFLPAEAHA